MSVFKYIAITTSMNILFKKVLPSFFVSILLSIFILLVEAKAETDSVFPFIPGIKEFRGMIDTNPSIPDKVESYFAAKDFYFQIQSKTEQLKISKEVRDHFETSTEKAEQKYDRGEEGVSQSDITKLKLGLAGTLNDIYELTAEIDIAKLSLGHLLGIEFIVNCPLDEDKMIVLEYDPETFDDALLNFADRLEFKKQLVKIKKAENVFKLAQSSRKITRTLLVTEVANYDFGIGNPSDLFEALIIYTRVLRGYYQAVYDFNKSVINMELIQSKVQPVQ